MRIVLNTGELADTYAMLTLYEYLEEGLDGEKIEFSRKPTAPEHIAEIFKCVPIWDGYSHIDLMVSCYTDISTIRPESKNLLEIDQSILKNCDMGLITPNNVFNKTPRTPVVVIGFADQAGQDYTTQESNLTTLVNTISEFSQIRLIGGHRGFDPHAYGIHQNGNVKVINRFGVLRAEFAYADISLYGTHLDLHVGCMHNLMEATIAGKLFLVPSTYFQYGLSELEAIECVQSFSNFSLLLKELVNYIQSFDNQTVEQQNFALQSRNLHIKTARNTYLPLITSHMMNMLGLESSPNSNENMITIYETGRRSPVRRYVRRLMHPNTTWRVCDSL